jgi:PAH dioxygenase large subunit
MTLVDQSPDVPPRVDRRYLHDEDIFRDEMNRVFGRSWLLLGHESEIREPGDYVTRRMGHDPVIVVRDEGGQINVLLNSCIHRGTVVCKAASGNSASFICGYHGWLYGNDGRLTGVPGRTKLYGAGFSLKDRGLLRARTDVSHGLIFATFDAEAPPLAEWLGEFEWYLGQLFDFFPGGMEVYGTVHRTVIRGNWKLHAENFCGDSYHVRTAHRTMYEMGVIGQRDPDADTFGWMANSPHGHGVHVSYITEGPLKDDPFLGHPEELAGEAIDKHSEEEIAFRRGLVVAHGALFPNTPFILTGGVNYGADVSGMTQFYQFRMLSPISPDRHEVTYFTLVPKDAPDEWKKKSYLVSVRHHGSAAFFEQDDLENYERISEGVSGILGAEMPFNYDLGIGLEGDVQPPWEVRARVVNQDPSEVNQRNYFNTYLSMMEGGKPE